MADIVLKADLEAKALLDGMIEIQRGLGGVQRKADELEIAFQKVYGKIDQGKENFRAVGDAGKSAFEGITGMSLTTLTSVAGLTTGVIGLTNSYIELQKEIKATKIAQADAAMGTAERTRSFAVNAEQFGKQGKMIYRTGLMAGAVVGADAGTSATIANEMSQISDEDGNKNLDAAEMANYITRVRMTAQMTKIGWMSEDAITLQKAAARRGYAPGEMYSLVEAARKRGDFEKEHMAGLVASGDRYDSTEEVLAFATAIGKGTTDKGSVGARVDALGRVLDDVGEGSKFNQQFGLAGLSPSAKLSKIRETALKQASPGATEEEAITAFISQSDKFGVKGIGAESLAMALRNYGELQASMADYRQASANISTPETTIKAIEKDPVHYASLQKERVAAISEVQGIIGPEAEENVNVASRELEKGLDRRMKKGDGFDPATNRFDATKINNLPERIAYKFPGMPAFIANPGFPSGAPAPNVQQQLNNTQGAINNFAATGNTTGPSQQPATTAQPTPQASGVGSGQGWAIIEEGFRKIIEYLRATEENTRAGRGNGAAPPAPLREVHR